MQNTNGLRTDRLSIERALELSPERIVSQRAQGEVGTSRGSGGPVHQLGEVEKEAGLHVVFLGFGLRVKGRNTSP